MSRPVSILYRRVDPLLVEAASALLPAVLKFAGVGARTPEDVLRLATAVGLVVLDRAASGSAPDEATVRKLISKYGV